MDDYQSGAVQAPLGRTLVWAGAGSGKTHVLTRRIAYLLDSFQTPAEHILAVTFSRKAAKEMRTRLEKLLTPEITARLTLGTFHRVCIRMLREEIAALPDQHFYGRRSNVRIIDDDDQEKFGKRAIGDTDLEWNVLKAYIDEQKRHRYWPYETPQPTNTTEQHCYEAYETYEHLLEAANVFDFNDAILFAVRLLEEHPAIRQRRQRRWQHILTDEFQDTNGPQWRFIELLAKDGTDTALTHASLFVVGDAQQAIYGWRGSRIEYIVNFQSYFPDARTYLLPINYRSAIPVLEVAMEIADRSFTGVERLDLIPYRTHVAPEVAILQHDTVEQEAETIAQHLTRTLADKRIKPNEIAILLRAVRGAPADAAQRTVKALEAALYRHRLQFVTIGVQAFYRNPIIRTLVRLLYVLADPEDDMAMQALLETPLIPDIGDKTIHHLLSARSRLGMRSLWSLLRYERYEGFAGLELKTLFVGIDMPEVTLKRRRDLQELGQAIENIRSGLGQVRNWQEYLVRVRAQFDFDRRLRTDESDEGFAALMKVFAATIQEEMDASGDLLDILNSFAVLDTAIDDQETGGAIQIMSIHKSKGLEFHTVVVPGMEHGVFPSKRSLDSRTEREEEGRLCYVALTRARESLILGYVPTREGTERLRPSAYLEAIGHIVAAHEALVADRRTLPPVPPQHSPYALKHIELDLTHLPFASDIVVMLDALWPSIVGSCPIHIMLLIDEEVSTITPGVTIAGDDATLSWLQTVTGGRILRQ